MSVYTTTVYVNDLFAGETDVPPAEAKVFSANEPAANKPVQLMSEHSMDIFIQNAPILTVTCTPLNLPELVAGRLLTEQMVDPANLKEIRISEDGRRADVFLHQDRSIPAKLLLTSQLIESLKPVASAAWTREQIFQYAEDFENDNAFHRSVRSAHGTCLFSGNKCLFKTKDISRHNTLDKIIGYALLNQIDLSKCAILSSGRVPLDMISKVIAAGIPLCITKKTPSREAALLAEKYHVTLIGKAEADYFELYTNHGETESTVD